MGFKANENLQSGPEGLPVGYYDMTIENAESKQSSNGHDMVCLKIRVAREVTTDRYQNALQWENLVIGHPSDNVVRIAKGKLAEICLAVGIDELEELEDGSLDLTPLIGKRLLGDARESKAGRRYVIYNRPLKEAPEMPAQKPAPVKEPAFDDSFDDDIPF